MKQNLLFSTIGMYMHLIRCQLWQLFILFATSRCFVFSRW